MASGDRKQAAPARGVDITYLPKRRGEDLP
jgi:hypothetical protein